MIEKIIKIPGKSFEDLDAKEIALMIEADSSLSPNGNTYFASCALDEFVHFADLQRNDLKRLQKLIRENLYVDVPGKKEKKIDSGFLINLADRVRRGEVHVHKS